MAKNKEEASPGTLAALHRLNECARTHKRDTLRASDLMDVVGVIAGIKPAALIDRTSIPVDLIAPLGLAYETSPRIEHIIYLARDSRIAKRLAVLHQEVFGQKRMSPQKERAIGQLLGYPKTATEYFIRRFPTVGTPDELPLVCITSTQHTASAYFEQLVLSPDHWKEEVATYCRPLEAAVREMTPAIYEVFVRAAKREVRRMRFHQVLQKVGMTKGLTEPTDTSTLYVED